ncbi:hypothetical protein P171DRAFT_511642 [Karstenula rhodostoma CBS 690.94]|uniref:AB hydrolase-1 domain-containing protein n=1 Tax=Karstenula rhodostoma CBS 690.94 TaxID=1392251 RepID=A0A9P4PR47_9PLEO|nr:hypothetical protein P171DRAFT_511642 [Karstenula rhodostoma CBS 690.94]
MAAQRPFIVIVPGASQSPAHYGYLTHILQLAGYPVWTGLLPSVGSGDFTAEDDAKYVRDHLLIPVLDHEEHDVIVVMHSYSSVPGSHAVAGLGKAERAAQGKKGVIGQVYISAMLLKGGDGQTIVGGFGGQYPPHIRADPPANLLRCDDRVGPLYQDVTPSDLRDVVAVAAMAQGIPSFNSPVPRATWDSDQYKGRIAFIKTLNDGAIPPHVQQAWIEGTGVEWKVKEMQSGHSPQLSQPEKLSDILLELAKEFEAL